MGARASVPIKVNHRDIAKRGRLDESQPVAPGGTPNRWLYLQADGDLGPRPSRMISMLPLSHDADSFGYVLDALPTGYDPEDASWSWLLDPRIGSVALHNSPSIAQCAMDAVLAVQAAGLATFTDSGNLTIEEIDRLRRALMELSLGT